jgi:hypothetical protein
MSLNQPQNNTEKTLKKSSVADLQEKKASILQKLALGASGLALGLGTMLPSMGAETKGILTPDMQPTVESVKTQDGSALEPQINPSSVVEGPQTQDGSQLSTEIVNDGNGKPMDYDLIREKTLTPKQIIDLNEMTKTPLGRSQITDDLGGESFFSHSQEKTNIGDAWIPEEHPGE